MKGLGQGPGSMMRPISHRGRQPSNPLRSRDTGEEQDSVGLDPI